tara:strand:- start:2300 stop:4870 length:2571 start_codon:yes stop_codon:yes gene_type:complete
MSAPVWTTTAGKLGSADEQATYSLQLEANTADSTAITYSVIAGSLPPGLTLTSSGLLTGVPAEVPKRTLYTFVIRATAGSTVTDRTFSLDIKGADAPTFTTSSGQLQLDDSTRVGLYWVLDGSAVSVQLLATDTDTAAGQTLSYEIVQGELPPGVTMDSKGQITGVVQLTQDQKYAPRGGFDAEMFPDWDPDLVSGETQKDGADPNNPRNIYDYSVTTKSISKNFEFKVRVTDGASYAEQVNSIFVYSADYWRVSNNQITVDQSLISGTKLSVDFSANRRPVFKTPSDLGTFRHDNQLVVKIDVEDFDPQQADLEYSIQSGSLPPGVSINLNTGELSGTLPKQAAVETEYNFTIRANRVVSTGINVFTDQAYKIKIIGDIDIGITFLSNATLGTITVGQPCLLNLEAVASEENRVLTYNVSEGTLPPGITLSPQGNFIGTINSSDLTDSTTAYTFSVTVSDQYQSTASTKEFTINLEVPYTTLEFANMSGTSTSRIDENIFYTVAQDPNINNEKYIFRPEDPEFGMRQSIEMLLLAGLETKTLTQLQNQMEENHSTKTLYFGGLKTAIAKKNNILQYEVVYLDIVDPLENKDGEAVSREILLRSDVAKPVLGPRASTVNTTTDANVYEVTTDGGLSFSTSGSKVRYANQLSADLDFVTSVYPNAVNNMRDRMKSLGNKEYSYLPLWMRTTQVGDRAPLGYVKAVPIAYCKPGSGALVLKRIKDKNLKFGNIHFQIDKYKVSNSKITSTFTGDGSTTSFVVNEIVHEEDIKVKVGNIVFEHTISDTADMSGILPQLTADTQLNSADRGMEIKLTHDTENQQTTIIFTTAPADGVSITVDRKVAKYLVFNKKGILNGQ